MKKTQIKDALRNIAARKVSFLSVIVIAFLGVTTFLGTVYSAGALRRNGSARYDLQHFRDIEIASTLLLSEEDMEEILHTEGVADAEGVLQVNAVSSCGGESEEVTAISLTERINLVETVSGQLPQGEGECAVESLLAEAMGWQAGDRIRLAAAEDEQTGCLREGEYVITGIVVHPDHLNTLVVQKLYVLLPREAFDEEKLDGCVMKAEIAIARQTDADRYSGAYDNETASVMHRLEEVAEKAEPRRDEEIRQKTEELIASGEKQLADAKSALAEARGQLDDGEALLAEKEGELADAEEQLAQYRSQLDDAGKALDEANTELTDAKAQLTDARTQLDEAAAVLRDGESKLDEARDELVDGWNQLEEIKSEIRSGVREGAEEAFGDSASAFAWAESRSADPDRSDVTAMTLRITETFSFDLSTSLQVNLEALVNSNEISDELLAEAYEKQTGTRFGFSAGFVRATILKEVNERIGGFEEEYTALQEACAAWDEGHAEYLRNRSIYYDGYSSYEEKNGEYESSLQKYEEGLAEYQKKRGEYEDGEAEYAKNLEKLEGAKKELDEQRRILAENEQTYAEKEAEYLEGEQLLEDAKERLVIPDPCRWILLDTLGNAGFAQLRIGFGNLLSLKSTFALLFILVGALVIFATVSKMVDEQRNLIGTTKALGFYNREVFVKYLGFGVTAAAVGSIFGILAARFGMEPFALKTYGSYYVFDISEPYLPVWQTLAVFAACVLLAGAAVWFAGRKLLSMPAVRLMQPRVPEGKKKSAGGRRVLSLYTRLILLNMRTDIRRVIVTIISTAGCCALIVTGFTLKHAMEGCVEKQYGQITAYDMRILFDPAGDPTADPSADPTADLSAGSPSDPSAGGDAEAEIGRLLAEAGADGVKLYTADLTFRIYDLQTAELICGDLDALCGMYHLNDWKTGERILPSDEGIFIQRRLAEMYDLAPGSELEIALGGVKPAKVRVAGVFEHYFGQPMVMSGAYFEKAFREPFRPNTWFVRYGEADRTALEDAVRAVPGFVRMDPADAGKELFDSSAGVINTLVALFIIMAVMMAGVVLLNLTSLYVLQKKRELTVMRINGFTVREVIGYMVRETAVTTSLGILLGLAAGSGLAYRIVRAMEQPFLRFDRGISFTAWLFGAGMTLLFVLLVNVFALRPVRNLKLTDMT